MRKILFGFIIFFLAVSSAAIAQGPYGGYRYCPHCGAYLDYDEGRGWGMGPGMMGPGYGMGPGMRYGMGPGMMGPEYGMMGQDYRRGMESGMMGPGYGRGMGPGMMGPGYGRGMGPGMMGSGYGYGYGLGPEYGRGNEECAKFYEETADLRKKLLSKQYDFNRAMRDPKTDPEQLATLSKELYQIRQQIAQKAPAGCGWQ
ncbi:MAG: hypothetical protein M0P57_04645 [Syntrophales bacterium]|nr:hypothetical protein [Syntrophales bacterium]MDY0043449.1 hypothetical protein [Syntrophales bacterium]